MAGQPKHKSAEVAQGGQESQELFKLLDDFCTAGQLRDLIRVYRPNSADFPVSVNREEAFRSVQKLYGAYQIPRARLEELLERAEENGHQHIFFYTATSKAVQSKLNDFAYVEQGLLGGKTRAKAGLPKFQIHPRSVEVADLRDEERQGTKYSTWTYKLYAGAERWVLDGPPVVTGDEKTVKYKLRYKREVIVAKWHSFGLLELRLPIAPKKQLAAAREQLLATIVRTLDLENLGVGSARRVVPDYTELAGEYSDKRRRTATLDEDVHPEGMQALVPLHLPTATAKLDQEARNDEVKWISVNETEIDVDGYRVVVGTEDGQENIYGSQAVIGLLKTAKKTERLRVVFHLREKKDSEEKFSVELCGYFKNEIRIAAQTTPEAVEFVVRRVWERSREEVALPPSEVDAFASSGPAGSALTRIDFDTFARHHPSLAGAILRLGEWVARHPTAEYLEAERLRKALGTGLGRMDVATAVGKLVEEGILQRKYRIRPARRRTYIPEVFDSFDAILESGVTDEEGEPIDLREADIVAVYGAVVQDSTSGPGRREGRADDVKLPGKVKG